ncbi:MAG: acyl-CoA dehydrogenase [Burkholderiaceae bacterium]
MSYSAPVEDIRFVLEHLADLDGVLALPHFGEVSTDVVDAVLDENARFVQEVVAPLNREGDQHPPVWSDGRVTAAKGFGDAFKQFGEGGWQGLQHDPRWGGQGLPKVVGAAVSETLNSANVSFALCPMLTDGVIEALTAVGSSDIQDRYIPPMLEGRWTGTMNLTEPQAGSDLSLLTTRAVPQGDGTYRLSGQKIFITYGEHDMAENIIHLVLARTPDAPKGVKGISLFLVPKFLVNDDGSLGARNDVWCASIEHKLGIHGSPTAVMLYGSGKGDAGEGAVGYLVGQENRGLEHMFIMMNAARYAVGMQGVAVSERALQQAVAYAHDRVQSRAVEGSDSAVAIVRHPDVQRMLLTMRGLTEGARALALFAAMAHDKGEHHTDTAEGTRHKALYDYLVPIVKGFSTEMSVEVASLGIQVHGGMGFIEETGAAQHYRDARILPIYEGTTAIQANDLIGRKMLRDAGAVAGALAQAMQDTVARLKQAASQGGEHADGLNLLAERLDAACQAYQAANAFVLSQASSSIRAVFLGSVPYLMLAGYALSGWQLARSALACNTLQTAGDSTPFHRRKLATAVFYAAHVLPRCQALSTAVVDGVTADRYAVSAFAD